MPGCSLGNPNIGEARVPKPAQSALGSIRGKGHDFDLVSVRIPEEGCVIMWVVLGTNPRRTFACPAVGAARLVELVHSVAMARIEGDVRAVSRRRGLAIGRPLKAEQT